MHLHSPAFLIGGNIPFEYTCDGDNISPPLYWDTPPNGVESFVLIFEDPDAPTQTFTHWLIYNLSPTSNRLTENIPKRPTLAKGGMQGTNDFDQVGYGGPCPPQGTHRYMFKLYALDNMLSLSPGATKAEVLAKMDGRVLDAAELMGRYTRQSV